MCDTFNDPRAMDDIRSIVRGFITRGECFTAAHVTLAARSQALWAGTLGHNRGISPVVRSMYKQGEMAGYQRFDLGGFNAYCPSGTDTSSVNLRIGGGQWLPRIDRSAVAQTAQASAPVTQAPVTQAPVTTPAPAPQKAAPKPAPAQTAPRTSGIRSAYPLAKEALRGITTMPDGLTVRVEYNSDGYAQMPSALLNALGINAGDGVVLEGSASGGTCTLRKAYARETPTVCAQAANGALRIRDRLLMPLGVGLNEDVLVSFVSGTCTLA